MPRRQTPAELSKMQSLLAVLLLSTAVASQGPPQPRDLTCDICVDVVTDLDEWLTSDTTEQQIVEWVEQVKGPLKTASSCQQWFV